VLLPIMPTLLLRTSRTSI